MTEPIQVVEADITTLQVDAIVNAANPSMLGGRPGTVDGAVHTGAGPRMAEACAYFAPCPLGRARITPGFDLPARWVIHTSGPIWQGGDQQEDAILASCYVSALSLASIYDARTIAIPAISTGSFRFPPERAARIAVETVAAYLDQDATVQNVLLVCRGAERVAIVQRALDNETHRRRIAVRAER
ncbi:MAG: macro domain-containing protein [Thermomicrobiales bacterium]